MTKRIRYDDEMKEKVRAEVKSTGNKLAAAKKFGVSYPSVIAWVKGKKSGSKDSGSEIKRLVGELVKAIRAEEKAKLEQKLKAL